MTFLCFISLSNFSGWIAISLPFHHFHSEKGWWFECQKRQASNKMQKKQFWRPRPLFSVMVTSPTPCESLRTIRGKKQTKKQKQQKEQKTSREWGQLPFVLSFGAGLWGVFSFILIGCLDFWGVLDFLDFWGRSLISSHVEQPLWNKWCWRSCFFLKFQKNKLVLNKFLFYLNIKKC